MNDLQNLWQFRNIELFIVNKWSLALISGYPDYDIDENGEPIDLEDFRLITKEHKTHHLGYNLDGDVTLDYEFPVIIFTVRKMAEKYMESLLFVREMHALNQSISMEYFGCQASGKYVSSPTLWAD